jgi:hypothetical protein
MSGRAAREAVSRFFPMEHPLCAWFTSVNQRLDSGGIISRDDAVRLVCQQARYQSIFSAAASRLSGAKLLSKHPSMASLWIGSARVSILVQALPVNSGSRSHLYRYMCRGAGAGTAEPYGCPWRRTWHATTAGLRHTPRAAPLPRL